MNTTGFDFISIDFTDDSDVDALFGQLETFQPPVDLVGNIMQAVSRLPQHQASLVESRDDFEDTLSEMLA